MDVLNRKARICLIEPNRSAVCSRGKVNEFLQMLSAWRGRRVLSEFEYKIEDRSYVFGKIGNVLLERAVIDGEETDLVILQRHELCEVGCADLVQVLRCPMPPRPQDQLNFDEGKFRFDGQDHQ